MLLPRPHMESHERRRIGDGRRYEEGEREKLHKRTSPNRFEVPVYYMLLTVPKELIYQREKHRRLFEEPTPLKTDL